MCTGLTFSHAAPRRPAAYGASSAFTITPSWPARERGVERRRPPSRVVGDDARDPQRGRARRASSAAARSCSGASSRSSPSRWRRSKKNGVSGISRAALDVASRAEARRGDLERPRPAVVVAARSPRRRARAARAGSARAASHHLGHARGHVVERAREDRDVVAVAVDLDARAVELPLDRGAGRSARARRRRRARCRASIGASGRPTSQPHARRARRALAERDPATSARSPREHQRAAHSAAGHAGGLRDRVGHHARRARPGARSPAAAARRKPAPPRRRARAAPWSAARRAACEPGAGERADRARTPRRPRRRVSSGAAAGGGAVAQQRPADADLALA